MITNDSFCILPWIHQHIHPNGNVIPCCISDPSVAFGNTFDSSLEEIYNNEKFKDIRSKMLLGEKIPSCSNCYRSEKVGAPSKRLNSNQRWAEKYSSKVIETKLDGYAGDLVVGYVDIRFSNICNLKCRTCTPLCSSAWIDDHKALTDVEYPHLEVPNNNHYYEKIIEHLPYIDEIYWGGGEALITKQHYEIIEILEKVNPNVVMFYQTNFTNFYYKKRSILDYWKKFPNIDVSASLDGCGKQGEYLRAPLQWKTIIENRKLMMQELPEVPFHINCTVSAYNLYHVTDFHQEMVEQDLVSSKNFRITHLHNPKHLRPNIFPTDYKNKCIEKINKHIEWMEVNGDNPKQYNALIRYLEEDSRAYLDEFISYTQKLDSIRNEKCIDVFPELAEMLS